MIELEKKKVQSPPREEVDIIIPKKETSREKVKKENKTLAKTLVYCPTDHLMNLFAVPEVFGCNACEGTFEKGTKMYGCRLCDFDLCVKCSFTVI